jgi:hypothetical protein
MTMGEGKGKNLTRREFDSVIRRAAELSVSDSESGESALNEGELFRIAREVGLSEHHVRRALSEVRAGALGSGPLDRIFGPAFLSASRVVPGTPRGLALKLDDFLAGTQLLQPVRRGPDILQYRPALDWASQLARAASFTSRKYFVASAKSVEVHLDVVDDERTFIELIVDPGTRGDSIVGASLGGGAAGTGLGIAVGASLAAAAPFALAAGAGLVVGAGVASGITYAFGVRHRRKLGEVRAEVEGILDRLEAQESLEPPPASWRRWVKRQFHGVAHDLRSTEDDIEEESEDAYRERDRRP